MTFFIKIVVLCIALVMHLGSCIRSDNQASVVENPTKISSEVPASITPSSVMIIETPAMIPTPNPTPIPTPLPSPTPQVPDSSAKVSAQKTLSEELQVPVENLTILTSKEVQWPNTGLGCPQSGAMYAQVIVPGFKIIFEYDSISYAIHTNFDGSQTVLCYDIPTTSTKVKASPMADLSAPTVIIDTTSSQTPIPPPSPTPVSASVPGYIKDAWLCTSESSSEIDDLSTSQMESWTCAVSVEYTDANMIITSNGIPNHSFESGIGGPAAPQDYRWIIPLNPIANETVIMAPERGPISITVTGVPIYGPEEGPGGDAVALHHGYFIEDRQPIELGICGGHSGPGGTYHYHFDANCMHWHSGSSNQWKNILNWDTQLIDDTKHSPIIGFAFDGFAIYGPYGYDKDGTLVEMTSSYQLRTGQNGYGGIDDWEYIEGLGHLDECNGIVSIVPESLQTIYHYHSTQKNGGDQIGFPYFLLCYKGIPNESNFSTGTQQEEQPLPQNSRPPPPPRNRTRR